MEIGGPQNPANLNVDQVLSDVNDAAGQVNETAGQAQSALGRVFFSLLQRILSAAQENSSSGA